MNKLLIIEEGRLLQKKEKEIREKEYEDKTGMKCVIIDGGAKTHVVDQEIAEMFIIPRKILEEVSPKLYEEFIEKHKESYIASLPPIKSQET